MQQEGPTPLDLYSQRAREAQRSADQINTRCDLYQMVSVALGLLVCAFLYESLFAKKMPLWTSAVPLAAIVVAAKRAQQQRREVLKLLSVCEYYDKGIARLKHDWEALDDGKDFVDHAHIYATGPHARD